MTDQDLKDLVASLAESQAKTDIKLDRLADSQAKTDIKLDRLAESQAKTDAQLAKTDAQLAKTDKTLSKMAALYGGLGKNIGYAVEEFFYNSLKSNPSLNGVNYDFIDKNITRCKAGVEREFDILLVNGKEVAIIEAKHRANPSDIHKLINELAPDFRVLFPQYNDYRIHLVLATFSIADEVKGLALQSNVIILQRKGDLIETIAA